MTRRRGMGMVALYGFVFAVLYLLFTAVMALSVIADYMVLSKIMMALNFFITSVIIFTIGYFTTKDIYINFKGVLCIGAVIINILAMSVKEFSFAHTVLLVIVIIEIFGWEKIK